VRYRVSHTTEYRYDDSVYESHNELRLSPLATPLQRVHRFEVRSEPRARMFSYHDWLGNVVHYFNVHPIHERLTIRAESVVSVSPRPKSDVWRQVAVGDFRRERDRLRETYYEFLAPSTRVPALEAWRDLAPDIDAAGDGEALYDLVSEAFARVHARLAYDRDATRADTPVDRVLALGRGSSKDFSHVLIGALRGLGVPTRYVSGYGFHLGEPGAEAPPGASGRPFPFLSHAWVEAFLPGVGWCGIDPTHARPVDLRYVKVAVGRDYDDVVPVKGVFRGSGRQDLGVFIEMWSVPEREEVD